MRRSLLCFCLTVPAVLRAQPPVISPGTRVRVESLQSGKAAGPLVWQRDDSIAVAAGGGLSTFASQAVSRLDVSNGRSHGRGAAKGMLIGTAIGGGAVLVIFGGSYVTSGDAITKEGLGELAGYVAAGALEGVIIGAIVGAVAGAETWTTVYSGPVRIGFIRTNGKAPGLGASIRF